MSKYIIYCHNKTASATIGQKAANLFLLEKHFPVPEFAVITTAPFTQYRKKKTLDPEFEQELRKVLERFLHKGAVAIRSSNAAEDLAGISFAGMYSTTLNVTNVEDGMAAIISTWNSVDSKKVNSYCARMHIPPGAMAVIIQHQLQPSVSGVMVTQSPFSVCEILIECCPGLGDKLVSGEIDPTRYRIRGKETAVHTGENLLSTNHLLDLVQIGKKIESLFKAPQDIEWAIEKEKIYILQSRPILLNAAQPRRPCQVWSNVNVRETMPEPISPLWWSLLDDLVFSIFIRNVFDFPIDRVQYEKYRPIEMISGRVYWNVNNMIAYGRPIGPILDLLEGSRSMDPQLAVAFKAVDLRNIPKPVSSLRMCWFTIVSFTRMVNYMLLSFFRYEWMSKKINRAYEIFEETYKKLIPSNDLKEGIGSVKTWLEMVMSKFARRYFGGVFLSILYIVLLGRLLRLRQGKKGEATAHKIILGILDKTGAMVLAINNLAHMAKRKVNKVTVSKLKILYKTDREFKNLFDQFLNDFGHRGPAEFDIASQNWREDPEMVYKLIQTAKDSPRYNVNRKAMIAELLKSSQPTERFIIKTILPRLEAFTPLRENGKHIYLKAAARLKDQLFIIAQLLITQGYLRQKSDIFFFSLRDFEKIAHGKLTKHEAGQTMKLRKAQWKLYRKTAAPDIIYSSGERITTSTTFSKILSGESLSYGKVKGKARIIKNFKESHKLRQGEILVTHHTDPGWTPLFSIAAGVVIEVGGLICHAAMVARELGVPAIVINNATKLIPRGRVIELDANEGSVRLN